MSNTPWRTGNRYFNCEPNCPNRKPGCQDHCKKHIEEKARWEQVKAAKRQHEEVKHYTANAVIKNLDAVAKSKRDWRRYHRHSGS